MANSIGVIGTYKPKEDCAKADAVESAAVRTTPTTWSLHQQCDYGSRSTSVTRKANGCRHFKRSGLWLQSIEVTKAQNSENGSTTHQRTLPIGEIVRFFYELPGRLPVIKKTPCIRVKLLTPDGEKMYKISRRHQSHV